MSGWRSGFVHSNGIEMHYHRTGGEKPPVVLIHGITDSGLCWTRVAQDLEPEYDVVMVDARGHGRSTAPESEYTPQEHAADVAGLIEALALEKPALLGHSMGAAITSVVAVEYPHLISRILLEDPPWRLQSGTAQERRIRMEDWQQEIREHRDRTDEALLTFVRERSPSWDEAELGPWMTAKRSVDLCALQFVIADNQWQQAIPKIACPTLLITADPDLGAIVNAEAARYVTETNPLVIVVHIPGAGHNIRREQYRAYMTKVREFLAS